MIATPTPNAMALMLALANGMLLDGTGREPVVALEAGVDDMVGGSAGVETTK